MSTFEVGVRAHFTARHHLVGDFGPASEPHQHAYEVNVAVEGDDLRVDGTLFDIAVLQRAVQDVTTDLEGRDLNELDDLAGLNPTAEVVARYIFRRVAPRLRHDGLRRLTARVWESPEAYAAYTDGLG